jgi:hypothetical protein
LHRRQEREKDGARVAVRAWTLLGMMAHIIERDFATCPFPPMGYCLKRALPPARLTVELFISIIAVQRLPWDSIMH